jgi:hypothetical protein
MWRKLDLSDKELMLPDTISRLSTATQTTWSSQWEMQIDRLCSNFLPTQEVTDCAYYVLIVRATTWWQRRPVFSEESRCPDKNLKKTLNRLIFISAVPFYLEFKRNVMQHTQFVSGRLLRWQSRVHDSHAHYATAMDNHGGMISTGK